MRNDLSKDVTLFCEQMAMILKSGISASDGLMAIAQEVEDEKVQKIFIEMAEKMDHQVPFSVALREADGFDEYMICMVEIGEKSGYLDDVMEQLAIYYGRIDETRDKIKDAVTYPGILICMMLVVIAILVIKVLPLFSQVLNNMGSALPSFALALMNFGNLLARYGLYLILVFAALVLYLLIRTKREGKPLMVVLSNFFATKKMGQDLAVAQFAFAMSLLLNSGYDSEEALSMMPTMIQDDLLQSKISKMQAQLKQGVSFNQAIIEAHIFKGVYNRVLTIGFKAGKAEETMAKIAQEYENEVDASINRFLDVIEPTLVAILSIIVGIILLSVMLPLMSIMSAL